MVLCTLAAGYDAETEDRLVNLIVSLSLAIVSAVSLPSKATTKTKCANAGRYSRLLHWGFLGGICRG